MFQFGKWLPFTFRRWFLAQIARRRFDVRIGHSTLISKNTEFEGMNKVMDHCEVSASSVGRGTYIASGTIVRLARIGRFCSIGSRVKISLGRHPTRKFASTHPAFFSTKKQAGFTFVERPQFQDHLFLEDSRFAVMIGNDVWIGDNVLIADGVQIGNGAIIGAGAIVTKSIEPYSINVGVPSYPLRFRFDSQTIALLQQFKWWDKDVQWIQRNVNLFADIENFVAHIQSELN